MGVTSKEPKLNRTITEGFSLEKGRGMVGRRAEDGHKRRKGFEGADPPCVASIDAAGVPGTASSGEGSSRGVFVSVARNAI